jgi:hypothetical protein
MRVGFNARGIHLTCGGAGCPEADIAEYIKNGGPGR